MQTLKIPEEQLRSIIREEIAGAVKEEFAKLKSLLMPGMPPVELPDTNESQEDTPDWEQMYGIGKDIWNTDAQAYVNSLREDRY